MTKSEFIYHLNEFIKERKTAMNYTFGNQNKYTIELQIMFIENILNLAQTDLNTAMKQYNEHTNVMLRYAMVG